MLVEKTNMVVSNVNSRKEGKGEDGGVLAMDVKGKFEVPRAFMDKMVPDQESKWSNQFFTEKGDLRLPQLYPINIYQKFDNLRIEIYMGKKPTEFLPAKMTGVKLEPLSGGYVSVEATLQIYPSIPDAGKIDNLVKTVVPIAIDGATMDVEDAEPKDSDS